MRFGWTVALALVFALGSLPAALAAQWPTPPAPDYSHMPPAIQNWLKTLPKCKYGLEGGGGPMRCANPNDPNSAASIRHPLFALLRLPVPGQQDEPVCLIVTQQNYLESGNYMVPITWKNDPWERQPEYAYLSYQVHLADRRLTLINALSQGAGERKFNRDFKLEDVPRRDWPCSLQTWSELLDERVPIANVPDRRY